MIRTLLRPRAIINVRNLSLSQTMAEHSMMRAVRVCQFGGPEVLKVDSIPVPSPSGSEVLIKVEAAGVNPVDTYIRSGLYAHPPTLPYVPGADVAGVIDKVGPQVTKYKPGDRVYTVRTLTGGYAEYSLAQESLTFPLLDNITCQQGAAIGTTYFTAYRALFARGQAKPGETVLIHGASGGVGLAACQLARAHGLRVLGTGGTELGLRTVEQSGAHLTFNHRQQDYVGDIREATKEHGIDIIIEMLSNVNLETDLELLGQRGRLMVVGSRGRIEIDPRLTMSKETDIRGVMLPGASQEELAATGAALLAGQETGWLRPVIGHTLTLEEAPEAHHEVLSHSRGTQGKIILLT